MSGGEQQMLAIGRALMTKPRLLLLDEPTLGLAPLIINQIFEIIQTIRAEGVTVFLVEQNANKALHIADRAYVLETGKVVLEDTGANPYNLTLEVTEGLLITDFEKSSEQMQKLQELGINFSIDDFGTGYSNLSYLKRFAVDKLKIDQSFVQDMENDSDNYALVRAIIQLAHSLGLSVTAEGVETEQQVQILTRLQCDEFQGYYFAKPMPADELVNYLQARSE